MANLTIEDLRIRRVLKEKLGEPENYSKLEESIRAANGGKRGMDRRKLKRLVEGQDLPMRISDFLWLDAYLVRFGEGLAARAMFEQPDVMTSLSEASGVAFLFGAYPRTDGRRTDVSIWDVRAAAEVGRGVNECRGSAHIEIEDVMSPVVGDASQGDDEHSPDGWQNGAYDNRALVCVGSPKACRATEWMLAAMFEQDPHLAPRRGETGLPFHFIWCKGALGEASRFADLGETIRAEQPKLAARLEKGDFRVAALRTSKALYTVEQESTVGARWTDYGVIAVQRRARDGIWVALCGLSGPATFAAARVLRRFAANVPSQERTGSHSPIMWAVVKAEVELTGQPGDNRAVISESVHAVDLPWDPRRGREVAN